MNKLSKLKPYFWPIVLVVLTLIAILIFALFNAFKVWDSEKAPVDKDDTEGVIDVTQIPSYLTLQDTMVSAVDDIYGLSFEELVTQNSSSFISLPQTEIIFEKTDVSNEIDLMVVTAMALKRNPYIQLDEHPVPLKGEPSEIEGSLRILPTGEEIDLARLEQQYSNVKLFVTPNDPTKYEVKGYDNGSYFEESVDLMGIYVHYATN